LTALALALFGICLCSKETVLNLQINNLRTAQGFLRLSIKALRKTMQCSVKKISLFDPGETGRVWKFLAKHNRFLAFRLQRRRPDTSVWLLFPAVGKK
jgi:hypothetical protein